MECQDIPTSNDRASSHLKQRQDLPTFKPTTPSPKMSADDQTFLDAVSSTLEYIQCLFLRQMLTLRIALLRPERHMEIQQRGRRVCGPTSRACFKCTTRQPEFSDMATRCCTATSTSSAPSRCFHAVPGPIGLDLYSSPGLDSRA